MRDIKGLEGVYAISEEGKVWSYPRKCSSKEGKFIKSFISSRGYARLQLRINKKQTEFKIHRLVAAAYVENPNNYLEVNHLDGNKLNNHFSNLEWCTRSQNLRHAWNNHLYVKTDKHISNCKTMAKKLRKFSDEQVREIRKKHATRKHSIAALAREYQIAHGAMSFLINRKTYQEVI